MADIFISYASEDSHLIKPLIAAFDGEGWSVWWDRTIPIGKSFDEVIEAAIQDATCIVVLWSKHSINSRWVKAEAREGAQRGVLVPILLDSVQIPLEFRTIQSANLVSWREKANEPEFTKVIESIRALVETRADQSTIRPTHARKSGDFHGKRHIEVTKNRQRILVWISGITLVGSGLALLTTYLTFGKPWWEIIYPVFLFLAFCCLWAPRFYRTWMLDWNKHEILVINWWSLLGRSGEEIWIDGQLKDKRVGGMRFSGTLRARIITPERQHAVVAYLGNIDGGLRVGCQIVIDNELIGGDTAKKFIS